MKRAAVGVALVANTIVLASLCALALGLSPALVLVAAVGALFASADLSLRHRYRLSR